VSMLSRDTRIVQHDVVLFRTADRINFAVLKAELANMAAWLGNF
jgi:hypothetical protein